VNIKIIFAILLSLSIFLIFSDIVPTVIHTKDQSENKEFLIRGINSESPFYSLSPISGFYNLDRDEFIFPNDRLRWSAIFEKPVEDSLTITIEFKVVLADDIVKSYTETFHLSRAKTFEIITFQFSPSEQGIHELKYDISVTNGDGQLIWGNVNKISFEVSSLQEKLMMENNQTNSNSLIFAGLIGSGTIGTLIWNIISSKREINSIERQNIMLQRQNRPWIGRENTSNNIGLEPNQIIIAITNHGKSPALNIVTRSFVDSEKPPENAFDLTTPSASFALVPGERGVNRTIITPQEFKLGTTTGLNYGLRITYTDGTGLKGVYEIRGHFENGVDIFDNIVIE